MAKNNSKPVVLLIYAKTGQELVWLEKETDAIEAHLKTSGLCDVRILPAATLSDVGTAINAPSLRDRVAIVHYAGHANGQGIQLQSDDASAEGETAYMRGLAGIFKLQPHLRLLFINGCASREQVLELTQAGIPLVIATNRGIDDKVACDFARCFYRTLGQQRSIAEAFQAAAGELTSATGKNVRDLYDGDHQKSAAATSGELPWELHGPDADRHWSLREPFYRGTGPRWDHTKFEFNPESPYLGLRYFTEEDSSRFFGRDEFVQTLMANESAPLLLVIGASGTGKSSIVRAGMIPHWKKKHPGLSRERAFVFTPQDDPFEQLASELARIDKFDRQQIRSIRETPSRTALRDAVATFGQGESWLIFVDQFEQIFTRTTDPKKRADFLDAIEDIAKSEHPSVCLVLAMRDDFFPQLRDYPELFPLTDKHCFRVAALSRAALQEVIERPAAEHGVTFEPGLVQNIIEAVDRQPGALPLLQYALDALWKAEELSDHLLNEATYTELGGVTGSLGRRLQALYDHHKSEQDQFRWMMLKLVTYDDSATERSVVSRLAPKVEFAGRQADLLDELIGQGLVVSSGTSTPSVQLGHEKIIEAWPEFTKWTQEYRDANTVRQQLTKAASDWAGLLARDEKQKAMRALWQGSQLEKARELRQRGDFDQLGGLGQDEQLFLNASYAQSRTSFWRLQMAMGVAILFAVLAIRSAWIATANFQLAESRLRNLQIPIATVLAAYSRDERDSDPQLSVLLAVEAVKATDRFGDRVPIAEQELRDSLRQCTGLGLPGSSFRLKDGRSGQIAMSPAKDKWLATNAPGGHLFVWDFAALDPIAPTHSLSHPGASSYKSCAISPDNRWIAAVTDRGETCVWNLEHPREQPDLIDAGDGATDAVMFCPRSHWLIIERNNPLSLRLRKITGDTFEAACDISFGNKQRDQTVQFSSEGRLLLLKSLVENDTRLRVLNLESDHPDKGYRDVPEELGDIERFIATADSQWLVTLHRKSSFQLDAAGRRHTYTRSAWLWKLAANDPKLDGRQVVDAGHDDVGGLWNGLTENRVAGLIALSRENDIYLINPSVEVKMPLTEPIAHLDERVTTLEVSPDGKWLFAGDRAGNLHRWNLNNSEVRTYSKEVVLQNEGNVISIQFSPNGESLLVNGGTIAELLSNVVFEGCWFRRRFL